MNRVVVFVQYESPQMAILLYAVGVAEFNLASAKVELSLQADYNCLTCEIYFVNVQLVHITVSCTCVIFVT